MECLPHSLGPGYHSFRRAIMTRAQQCAQREGERRCFSRYGGRFPPYGQLFYPPTPSTLSVSAGSTSLTLSNPSTILPTTVTGLAALGFSSTLAGVGPKKRHKAFPGGQYPTSPTSTVSRASASGPTDTGMAK